VANLLLVHSLAFSGPPTWNVPSWSISCEAIVYLLFALLVMTGSRRGRYFFLSMLTFAAICYAIVVHYKGSLFALVDLGLLRCMAGFCVGAAISTIPETAIAKLPLAIYNAMVTMLIAVAVAILSLSRGFTDILAVPVFAFL